jgi:hypothetical protein
VSVAILYPLALLLILLIVQAGLLWHAHNVLAESAQAGVNAGRVLGATGDEARAAATGFVSRSGRDVIVAPAVRVDRGTERVSVTVSGTAQRVLPIPGLTFRLSAGAAAPTERWTGSPP